MTATSTTSSWRASSLQSSSCVPQADRRILAQPTVSMNFPDLWTSPVGGGVLWLLCVAS
jgi:hypothetical protein